MLELHISPPVTNADLNTLFATAWAEHTSTDFQSILRHSLLYVCAYEAGQLVGYVNVAWDGTRHAFLLDTTVHADFQRRGIGAQLVAAAANAARERGIEWLHVDFEPHLTAFYQACGFQPTDAGLLNLVKG